MGKVVIIMGSKKDLPHADKIANKVREFGVECTLRVASAHKTPEQVLDILREYEHANVVYITVAGKSDALSGLVDANTTQPVIACPPPSDKFATIDIFSVLRMPTGVAPMVVLNPENAAIAAIKVLGVVDTGLRDKIKKYQHTQKEALKRADTELK